MKNFFSNPDPLNKNIPYTEKNFEIGFLSSIIHTFILIFFAELGDKTFIMLFILQLRTNKVTIFYSALFAEILMNTLASFIGFLIEYLLYKNLIEYLGILFFVIYGIFLVLSGFKTSEDTFEEEFEMIEDMHKLRINRTPSMILGLDENKDSNEQNDNDKYNLDTVNKYNERTYIPLIKKELTVIPESDISREDSIFNEDNLLSAKKNNNKEGDDDNEGGFILNNKRNSAGFRLNLKNNKKASINNEKNENKNRRLNADKKELDEEGQKIVLELDKENNNEEIEEEEDEEGNVRLRGRKNLYKSRSRYCLDYLDKNVNVDKPNIDNSIFGTIFFSICLSEFGDRTQLISLTTSSIFHFWGSILGSCLALFCTCLIGVYFSRDVMKFFKQKIIDFLLGAIFLTYGIQIYISKSRSQNQVNVV